MINETVKNKLINFKDQFFLSKKYWLIYLTLIVIASFSIFSHDNYIHPKMELIIIILISIIGIFCISYFQGHNNDKELYKTAFIIILLFGIVFSFLSPICIVADEVEHLVRAEMTSGGVIIPDYDNTSFKYEGKEVYGSYLTIQSILDLIEKGKDTQFNGYDAMIPENSTIFETNADESPINYTLVKYPSAFAQNPFFGYLAPAIGILIAKILDLPAIWLLWLGRLFNNLLYASLVAIAIKKTPILKMPLLVIACLPIMFLYSASVSIDSIINGLSLVTISYFFYLYKSPNLNHKHILKFSIIVLVLSLCKVTCITFILLLLFIPLDNFKSKKYYLFGIVSGLITIGIVLLWSKFYVNPTIYEWGSHRLVYIKDYHINSTEQIGYMLSHKKDSLISILNIPYNLLNGDLNYTWTFNSILLMFLGAVFLLYPKPKFDFKTKVGALLVVIILYMGTNILFMITWAKVGLLKPIGVQPRYSFPVLGLLPFIFGINHSNDNVFEINKYIVMISISFIAFMLIQSVCSYY